MTGLKIVVLCARCMLPEHITSQAVVEGARFAAQPREHFVTPAYNADTYVDDLIRHRYFDALMTLRHFVQMASHDFFSRQQGARNVDLFMLTPSISSPMGPGSDSEPIDLTFGGIKTHLVDSSQFGFEPLLIQSPGMVYCYLPSLRGEDPDARHLNQFFHCECEMTGTLNDVMQVVEAYVRTLSDMLIALEPVVRVASEAPSATFMALTQTAESSSFPRLSFSEAVKMLQGRPDADQLVRITAHGRDITAAGECALLEMHGQQTPLWVTHYDRDRVPFYQKPVVGSPNTVENADLLFPALRPTAFGGEVSGCGERQNSSAEIRESLRRQGGISEEPYRWYVELRDRPDYQTTSGFGLGIERFLAWALAKERIQDVILYPRLKGVRTYP